MQQLRQGVSEQAIRGILAQNGWPQPLVDRAFSMISQAQPHNLTPPAGVQPIQRKPEKQTAELPTPAGNPYPILESEKQRERKSIARRILTTLGILLVMILIAGSAYYFTLANNGQDKNATTPQTVSTDTKRKANIDKLSEQLMSYYSSNNNTYPTFATVNSAGFAASDNGFATTDYIDPSWNKDKSPCVNAQKQVIFSETHKTGCVTYRATAANGEDCDAGAKPCTRVVLTAMLDNKEPYIVALDQNTKE